MWRAIASRRIGLAAVAVVCAGVLYEARHARGLGVPTLTTLAYTGSLVTFGTADNGTHSMTLALFVAGANDGGPGSAACSTSQTVTCANGQFTIPLSSTCIAVVQANPNVQTELTIDTIPMGLVSVTAVPYAVEAGTAAAVSAANVTGVLAVANGGTGSSTENFVDLSSAQTVGGAKTFSSGVSVGGIVSSTSGGFQFPNGTVQASGGLTSNATDLEHVERLAAGGPGNITSYSQCTSSPCTIYSQSGSWVTGVTRNGTGQYTISFAAGEWTAPPTCVYTAIYGNGWGFSGSAYGSTTSSIQLAIGNVTSQADGAFNLICMGTW